MKTFLNGKILFRTIALSFVGMLGFAVNSVGGHTQEVRTLDRAELRRLLRNVSLTPVGDPGVISSNPRTETFYENGEYVRWGDRAHRRGTFEIENSRVCVRLSETEGPECYRIQRDRDGHMWKVDDAQIRTRVHLSAME